jgi:GMP synthase-like glutamine amidotransferase
MKPIAILQFWHKDGPGNFATFLDTNRRRYERYALYDGEAVPTDVRAFSGICLLGGPQSANDDHLAWIQPVLDLIRQAAANEVPVIGHCLGGQLMARALGGQVSKNPVKEIGWQEVANYESPASEAWIGARGRFPVFQWHGERFSLPPGAARILTGDWCENQAFVLGPHLGLQFHPEITPAMIAQWSEKWRDEVGSAESLPTSIQTPADIERDTVYALPAMRALASRLYGRWLEGLKDQA